MDTPQETNKEKKSSFWKELAWYAAFALLVVLPIRLWIAQPFVVNGGSMDTTFENGEYLIVDEISYRFHAPERGDVLIFKYPNDPSKYFIKRLIGLPGETVTIQDSVVSIENSLNPQGIVLHEPYIHAETYINTRVTLSPDEYFVMGDNRTVSSDSRIWGPLPKEDLIGRPVLRLLPISKFGTWPGEIASTTIENGI